MGKAWQAVLVLLGVWAVVQPLSNTRVEAQLDTFFYLDTCPQVYQIVASEVYSAIQNEARAAAFLLRLHFHDCFVQGCDASIALDSFGTFKSEQVSPPNLNSIPPRVYALLGTIKAAVEDSCPGIVSCADIITLGAFWSVILSRGPIWLPPLGRRDSFTGQQFNGTLGSPLPAPNQNFTTLQGIFTAQNLTNQDLVALSGAHTIGDSRCFSITPRIYNFTTDPPGPDPTLNTTLLDSLETLCPFGGDGNVTTFMDLQTPTIFDNLYYQNLLEGNGLFQTDGELVTADNDTLTLVETYAKDQTTFFADFVTSMIKMGDLNVLTGTEGEVRLNCSVRNPVNSSSSSSFTDDMADWDSQRTSERTETQVKYEFLKRTDSPEEFLKQVHKLVAEEIQLEELADEAEKLVEESVTWGHTYM